MALDDIVLGLAGVLRMVAGAYLLSFRPLQRPALLVGLALVLAGVGSVLLRISLDLRPFAHPVFLAEIVLMAWFVAVFPSRTRAASAAGVALGALAVWALASSAYLAMDLLPTRLEAWTMTDRLLAPTANGGAILFSLFVAARVWDLGPSPDDGGRAARLLYLTPLLLGLIASGSVVGQALTGAVGLTTFPDFLYRGMARDEALVQVATWWIAPGILALVALWGGRWAAPLLFILAGAVVHLPLVLRPDLDSASRWALTGWGSALAPALVMYAQARYRPFEGEPTAVRPTLLLTGLVAFFAYLLVFVATLILVPGELGMVVAAAAGIAAALVAARVALPRARREAMARVFAPTAARGLAPGDTLLDRYRVERLLAEGGQARVYEATDRRAKGRSARVVLKASSGADAAAEARILRELRHPHVIELRDVVEAPGVTLLVLEHAPGGDLRGLMRRGGGRLPTPDALRIAEGVLAGLAAAHAKGITHRDVKPENVLLAADGAPKLTDFGAARDAQPGATVRVGGLGTLAYLAPEQVRGEPGDARSDVYAAAVVIHEILTGARPIVTGSEDDFLARRAILQQPPRIALPAEAGHLAPLLQRALDKDPALRFANAGEMLRAIEAPVAGR